MITNKQLAALVAVRVETPDQCNAWIDSADRRCNKPCGDYLCQLHERVALRRLEKSAAKERAAKECERERLQHVNLDELRREAGRIRDRMNAVSGFNRHGTDDLAAYGGIGIRQTARQRRQYANKVDNALGEYTRLEKRLKDVQQRIRSVEWARGEVS